MMRTDKSGLDTTCRLSSYDDMRLKLWRLARGKTLAEMANELDIENARTYQRYEDGENRADAPLVQIIFHVTNGEVSPIDMHQQRLEWVISKRPDLAVALERFERGPQATEAAE